MLTLLLALLLSDKVNTPASEVTTYRACYFANRQSVTAPEYKHQTVYLQNGKVTETWTHHPYRFGVVSCRCIHTRTAGHTMTQEVMGSRELVTHTADSFDEQGRVRVRTVTRWPGPTITTLIVSYSRTTTSVEVVGVGKAVCYLNSKGQVTTIRLNNLSVIVDKLTLTYDGRGNVSSILHSKGGVGSYKEGWTYRYNEVGDWIERTEERTYYSDGRSRTIRIHKDRREFN